MRFPMYTPVQVMNPQHPKNEQVGCVIGSNPDHPDSVAVRFDLGGEEVIAVADVRAL